jgi:hypothetical protein
METASHDDFNIPRFPEKSRRLGRVSGSGKGGRLFFRSRFAHAGKEGFVAFKVRGIVFVKKFDRAVQRFKAVDIHVFDPQDPEVIKVRPEISVIFRGYLIGEVVLHYPGELKKENNVPFSRTFGKF